MSIERARGAEAGATVASRLQARHLAKSYGSRQVVKDVSLTVEKGEVVGLLGPGQTNLMLAVLLGFLPGHVRVARALAARIADHFKDRS